MIQKTIWLLVIFLWFLFSGKAIEGKSAVQYKKNELMVKYEESVATKLESIFTESFKITNANLLDQLSLPSLKILQEEGKILSLTPIFRYQRKVLSQNKNLSGLKNFYLIKFEPRNKEIDLLKLSQKLRSDPAVLSAEPNYLAQADFVPNDPLFSQQWGAQKIKAPAAWDILSSEKVVLDQGFTGGLNNLNLMGIYAEQFSQEIVPQHEGKIYRLEVEIGNWGGARRNLLAKLVDPQGNILGETAVAIDRLQGNSTWVTLNFGPSIRLRQGDSYKLYLRQEFSYPMLYWRFDAVRGQKNFQLYLEKEKPTLTPVIVAVIDSGIDISHEDLAGKILPGKNFVDPENVTENVADILGHGTHVTGIMAANFHNNSGIAGLTGESGAEAKIKILPIKALGDDGYGSFVSLAEALLFAAESQAKVINASWGASIYSELLKETIAGITASYDCQVVASAGNENLDLDFSPHNPAGYEEVISVGAADKNDQLSVWPSGRGSNFGFVLDVVAPGTEIISLIPGNQYQNKNGTSMAAPHVSAVYALVKALHPDWSKQEIRKIINLASEDLGEPGRDKVFGLGRLDFQRALELQEPQDLPEAKVISPKKEEVVFGQINFKGEVKGEKISGCKISVAKAEDPRFQVLKEFPCQKGSINFSFDLSRLAGEWAYLKFEVFRDQSFSPFYHADVKTFYVNQNVSGWTKKFSATALTSPAVADFANDGQLEIVTTGGNHFYIEKEKIYLFRNKGEDYPSWPVKVESFVQSSQPYIIETKDKEELILVSGVTEIYLYRHQDLNQDGQPDAYPSWPIRNLESFGTAAGDLDNDGEKEIVFINEPGQRFYNEIFAYELRDENADGRPDLVDGWVNPITFLYHPTYPLIANVNNDPYPEIIFLGWNESYHQEVHVLDKKGNLLAGWPILLEGYSSVYSPVVADLNGDGDFEIILSTGRKIYAYDLAADNRPQLLPGWPVEMNLLMTPVAADLDADGKQEVIVQNTGSMMIINGQGQVVQTISLPENEYFYFNSEEEGKSSLADLDGDGKLEMITLIQLVAAQSEKFFLTAWKIYPHSPQRLFSFYLPYYISRSSAIVGDLEGNGKYDLLLNTWDGRLNVFESPFASAAGGRPPWPMFNHDSENSRNFDFGNWPRRAACPLVASQEKGKEKIGLNHNWEQFVTFALYPGPSFSSETVKRNPPRRLTRDEGRNQEVNRSLKQFLDKIEILAGNYGGAARRLTCKVTDSEGQKDLSPEINSGEFRSDSGDDWREISFFEPLRLEEDSSYRLYCKGADSWNSLYWLSDPDEGKTYRLYLCAQ